MSTALAALLGAPILYTQYVTTEILTRSLILGLAAATVAFLYSYAGVLSLAQIGVFGTAGFLYGNFVTHGETKGLNLGWNPWLAFLVAVLIATAVAFVFGLVAARSFRYQPLASTSLPYQYHHGLEAGRRR